MTPKEKARELVEKHAIWCWNETVCNYEVAKECALITVNELIKETGSKYWYDVKKEIKKL